MRMIFSEDRYPLFRVMLSRRRRFGTAANTRETPQICLTLPAPKAGVLEMMHSQEVSSAFAALGDPTRLAILSRLADQGELTVQEIAQPFAMSLPAVSQHLKVLE